MDRGKDNIVGPTGALDPTVRAWLDALPPTPETLTPDAMRRAPAAFDPAPEAVASVTQQPIRGPAGPLMVRTYRPAAESVGAFVYLHGGGWVIGSLEGADAVCRRLANATRCAVLSVDYRLAPEHRYPAALDDAYAALEWTRANARELGVDPDAIVVGGSSAGGNLAAAVCLLARERRGPSIAMQVLLVAVARLATESESMRAFAEGYGLDRATMEWFARQYVRSEDDARDPFVSPLEAPDLTGLPPAIVVTAEFDCLRDDAEAYAARLRAAGVEATVIRYGGMIHGFMGLDVPAARLAADHIGTLIRERLAASPLALR